MYYNTSLGLSEFERTFEVTTQKTGDKISLISYSYFANMQGFKDKIISGYGEFNKVNGKYRLTRLYGETMKNAPVALLGFLDSRLYGGYFNGALDYDFSKNILLGSIVLENSRFKRFKIDSAAVFADKNHISILSYGNLENEPFNCDIELRNNLGEYRHLIVTVRGMGYKYEEK